MKHTKHLISPVFILALCSVFFSASLEAQSARPLPQGRRTPTSTTRPTTPTGRTATTPGGRTPTGATAANATGGAASLTPSEIEAQLADAEKNEKGFPKLIFDNAPADLFLQIYARVTKRTLLISPDVPKVIMGLRSNDEDTWTETEYLQAIETQLQLNGISIMPIGEKFLLVIPFKTIGQHGIETFLELPEGGRHKEEGRVIRQMIVPKYIGADEAQKAIETFKRPDGQIQYFERVNSLLVTDTQENVNRMIEIINFIDKAFPVQEEVHVRTIQYAKVDDIKARLEEFVAESQKQDEAASKRTIAAPQANRSGAPGISQGSSRTQRLPGPPNVTRPQIEPPADAASSDALISDADRGMIRGRVLITADVRSNKMIIITRKNNMAFFDRIIEELDVETAPDVTVEIIRLQYASADTKDGNKGVADLLNELIDNAGTRRDDSNAARSAASAATRNANLTSGDRSSTPQPSSAGASLSASAKSKIGELNKDNIKILPDARINGLMVMASPSDIVAIKEIVKELDIQLAQVLIETVVMEVGLTHSVATGIDWVRHIDPNKQVNNPWILGGGGGTTRPTNLIEDLLNGVTNVYSAASGITYLSTFKNLNLDMVIQASKEDGRTKIMTSPILLTQDNKEAEIKATELRYLYKGKRYVGYNTGTTSGGYEDDIEQRDVGLTVKITPRINPDGMVVLIVEEKFEQIMESGQTINGVVWPTVQTRELKSELSVVNGQTIVLGGLVQTETSNSSTGIPILKDIPWVGQYLFGSTKKSEHRKELLVFLTPHVFKNSTEAQDEARRRKDYLNAPGVWTEGWSISPLADPMTPQEKTTRMKLDYETQKERFEQEIKSRKLQEKYDKKLLEIKEEVDQMNAMTASISR